MCLEPLKPEPPGVPALTDAGVLRRADTGVSAGPDPAIGQSKHFYRDMEALFRGLSGGRPAVELGAALVPRILTALEPWLGARAGHVYRRVPGGVAIAGEWGEAVPEISALLAERLPELPWLGQTRAGLTGLIRLEGDSTVLALFLPPAQEGTGPASLSHVGSRLSALEYAVGQHLRRTELEDILEQARAIQVSLLPAGRPVFTGFDIAAVCVPAQSVGGDVFDFGQPGPGVLAITVADAAGKGLAAALQARDVVTGLRMGGDPGMRISDVVARLNRVVHRGGLASRFISMVYAVLASDGGMTYVNAGHPPPQLLDDGGFHDLVNGGMILGPVVDAAYRAGTCRMAPGSALLLYTDGVIERGVGWGDPFELERLRSWMRDWRNGPAEDALQDLLARLSVFGMGRAFEDDVSAVLVVRPR